MTTETHNSGTGTYVPSADGNLTIKMWGGGGGGGQGDTGGTNTAGDGGGGGGYREVSLSVTTADSFDWVVGAGGAGNDSPGYDCSIAGTGGSTTVTHGATTYTASGGVGGKSCGDGVPGAGGGASGGSGGTSASGDSGTVHSGNNGGAGGAGASGTDPGDTGGGGGAGGVGTSNPGVAGSAPGGGGGGGAKSGYGADGANGRVVFVFEASAPVIVPGTVPNAGDFFLMF